MHVKFQQSGGFAGLLRGCEFDTTELPAEEQARFRRLVRDASTSSRDIKNSQLSRDATLYEISLEDNGSKRLIKADDSSLTQGLAPLIEFLQSKARPQSIR